MLECDFTYLHAEHKSTYQYHYQEIKPLGNLLGKYTLTNFRVNRRQ